MNSINGSSNNSLLLCVKYILDFYFGNVSLKTIQTFQTMNSQSFTIDNAIGVLRHNNLVSCKKHISTHQLQIHALPSIIWNNKGEYFVYLKKNDKAITLYNPLKDKIEAYELDKIEDLEGILLIFRNSKSIFSNEKIDSKAWFYAPLKSKWRNYIEITLLTFFINIFALATPLFIMNVYNRVIPNQAFETLFVLASGTVLILIFDVLFKYIRNYILEKTAKELGLHWEEILMSHMLSLNLQYDNQSISNKINLFKELQQIRDFFAIKSIVQIIDFPLFLIAVLAIYFISPILAIITLVFGLFIVLFNFFMQIPLTKLNKNNLVNLQFKHGLIMENLQGVETIKLSNAIPSRISDWKHIVKFTDNVSMKMQSIYLLATNLSQTIVQIANIIVVIVGVYEIMNQRLNMGALIAVTMLSSRAMIPIINLSSILNRLKEMKESLIRIDRTFNIPHERGNNVEVGLENIYGKIELKNVSYSFPKAKVPILEKLNCIIQPGERVGIIGEVGAGKSTLMKLIAGLYTPTEGTLFIDDHDIKTIDTVELRNHIGVMTQEPFLFQGSLKENIELARSISKDEFMKTIKLAGLEEFVKNLHNNENFLINYGGSNLSTGQKHLITFARALINQPNILILDEPTSGLDIVSEKKLITHLHQNLLNKKTLLVITHRLAPLELVDRILVLREGKIVADGSKSSVLNALKQSKGTVAL